MRYEDASHTGAFQGQGPVANDDLEMVPAGSKSAATGNLITGDGTQSGSAGADSAAGAHITAIAGKSGEDTSFAGGRLSVEGEYGKLSVDAEGNYVYQANKGVENVRDRFTYTLADNQGATDSAALIVEIGKTPVVIKADAQQIVPGPDGVVTLPPGVELSDVHVVGRNLVIDMPDGTQLIIVDGAVFVPQLVVNGVEIPATNVAALLVGQEIQPAAGELPPSSGGNFAVPPPPLDPGVPLGDLIPPTEYTYQPPEPQEVLDIENSEPEAGVASAILDDDAQAGGIAGGVGDDPGTNFASGNLPGSGGDGSLEWALLASGTLPAGFSFAAQPNGDVWIMQGAVHVITVSVDPATGDYEVTQVAAIDHPAGGDENNLDFVIDYSVTDEDGDTDVGTLTINVDDDTPIAVVEGQVTGLVDEDDLPSGNNDNADGDDDPGNADGDNDGTTTAGAAGSLSGLFNFGADQPGTSGLGTNTAGMTAQGLTSNGVALTYQVAGDTLTASAGGVTIFTLTVHADGSWEFDLEGQLDHDVADTEDNLDIDFSSMIIGTDHDGDTVSLPADTFVITVDDDLPVPVGEQEQVTGLVDEDDLPAGNNDNADGDDDPGDADGDGDGTTTGGDEGSLSSLFSFGADQPGTVELGSDTSGLPALTSNNVAVTYSVQGNVLTASAGGSTVFTLTVNPDGSWVFDLEGQLDHPEAGTEDNLFLDFSSIIVGVDADGDTATLPPESFVVNVDDDMPQEFEECPEEVITVNEPGSSFTGDLNLPPVGADDPGVVSFGVVDGEPVLDTGDNPVTSNGVPLFYFINEDGVLEARAGDENGEVIFTITLNGDGTYTYEQVGTFGEGGQVSFEDLTSTSAGNVEFRGVGADDPATTVDLLLSAGPPDGVTVNTDSDSIGSANQSMDSGETVRIDFVSDLTSGEATPSGFGYTGHVSSSSFLGLIPQVQGDQSQTTAFTVWALNSNVAQGTEPDRDPTGAFSDSSITSITDVTVKDYLTGNSTTVDVTGFAVGVFTPVAYGISVRVNADGSVTFSGIQQGDSYGFNTDGGEFNAVVVQSEPVGTGGSTQDSFDLGVFSIGIANDFEPVDLQVPIVLTDADGDPVVCDIDIHVGEPLDAQDITVTVNEAGLDLVGSDPGSDSETQGGDLQGQVSGGTGPYTFAFAGGEDGNGAFGTLTLNPDGTFSYTLETPFDSQPDADDGTNPELGAESFQVVATDSLGATQTLTINVNIIDDVPTAVDDTDEVVEGGSTSGNVLTGAGGDGNPAGEDTPGADGFATDAVVGVVTGNNDAVDTNNPATVGVVITGTYGELTLNADGSYTYEAFADSDPPPGAVDEFVYTVMDGDGDLHSAVLTIDVIDDLTPTLDVPTTGEAGTMVDEAGLPPRTGEPAGTGENADGLPNNESDDSEITSGTINFTPGDEPATVTIDGLGAGGPVTITAAGQVIEGRYGTMVIDSYDAVTGTITYTYTLNDNVDHDSQPDTDPFTVRVEDVDGDFVEETLTIDIIDDEPIAVDDTDSIASGQYGPATGNVITDAEADGGEDNVGADDAVVVGVAAGDTNSNLENAATVGAVIQGTYGKLTLNSDGSYSYTRDAGTDGGVQDVFTYTIEDGDGDQTNATLTITIADATPDVPENTNVGLDDDALTGGNALGTGDDPDSVNTSGSVASTTGDGPLTYALLDTGEPVGFDYVLQGNGDLWIMQGTTHVLTVTLDQSGNYTVSQVNPIVHPDGSDENNVSFTVTFSATDQDGDFDEGTLTIDVDDDTPVSFNPVDLTDKTGSTVTTLDDALVNDGTANVIRVLNNTNADLSTGENFIGADGFGDIVFTATGHTNGEALESTGGTPLTSGGDPIYLFGFGTGVLTATTSADNSDAGAVVFTVTLTEGAGYGSASTYEVEFFQTIDDGSGFVFDDFSTAPAGQNDWIGLDADGLDINDPLDPNADSEDLLLTPTNVGGSVNTSATDIGNANQWIDTGEGIRLDYVVDVRRDPGSDEKDIGGYAFDGHYNVTDSSFTIMQTQGGGTASVRITAYNDPDTAPLDTLAGTIVPIDPASIVVTGQAAGTYDVVLMADGSVVVTGLEPGSSVEFEAVGDAFFNSYSITNANGVLNPDTPAPADTFTGDAFAIGVFGFNSETAGSPIDMSFDLTASDSDGDTATGTLDISLVPADSSSLTTLAATSESSDTSSFSLLVSDSDDQQVHKTAANSNTLTMAAAVAAAGMADSAAASPPADDQSSDSLEAQAFTSQVVESLPAGDGGDDGAAVSGLADTQVADEAAGSSGGHSKADEHRSDASLDAASNQQSSDEGSEHQAANDQGPAAASADAGPAAQSVAMVSAEALQAAGLVDNAQHGGAVEQIIADALGHGNAPETVDALLNAIHGENGGGQAIANLASSPAGDVSAWDMASNGGSSMGLEMLMKVGAEMLHHDMVQPTQNG